MNKDVITGVGVGLGFGLLTGIVLTLLYAPQSGKDTRQLIKDKAEVLVEKIKKNKGE